MTQISGRTGGMSALSGLDDTDDPNDPTTLAQTVGLAALTSTGADISAGDPLETSQSARDFKVTAASLKAVDQRQDAASASNERSAKAAVGGRSQGIPQALGEGGDNEGSLSQSAIAALAGRVRI